MTINLLCVTGENTLPHHAAHIVEKLKPLGIEQLSFLNYDTSYATPSKRMMASIPEEGIQSTKKEEIAEHLSSMSGQTPLVMYIQAHGVQWLDDPDGPPAISLKLDNTEGILEARELNDMMQPLQN